MSKKCFVTFADRAPYIDKAERLKKSMMEYSNTDFLYFKNVSEIGCMPHETTPFAFKPAAINKAFEMGYDTVLWGDSQVYLSKNIDCVFNHIEEKGYLIFDNIGFSLGEYTNDETLNHFNISRENSFLIKMANAKVIGLTNKSVWFDEYKSLTNLYRGNVSNNFKTESSDERCLGHRHDQSVLSCLAYKYNLDLTIGQNTFFANDEHKLVMEISKNVCLWAS